MASEREHAAYPVREGTACKLTHMVAWQQQSHCALALLYALSFVFFLAVVPTSHAEQSSGHDDDQANDQTGDQTGDQATKRAIRRAIRPTPSPPGTMATPLS